MTTTRFQSVSVHVLQSVYHSLNRSMKPIYIHQCSNSHTGSTQRGLDDRTSGRTRFGAHTMARFSDVIRFAPLLAATFRKNPNRNLKMEYDRGKACTSGTRQVRHDWLGFWERVVVVAILLLCGRDELQSGIYHKDELEWKRYGTRYQRRNDVAAPRLSNWRAMKLIRMEPRVRIPADTTFF